MSKNGTIQKQLKLCVLVILSIVLFYSCAEKPTKTKNKNILKIGTVRRGLKSASLLGDTYLSLFAQISNPPLMTLNNQGEITGLVADRVEVSEDSKIWKFYLDPDLYWSDGTKVTAADAEFSIRLIAETVPHARWIQKIVRRTRVQKDNALVLELRSPYSRMDFEFTTNNIIPKHIWEKIENPLRYVSTDEIVGCGPMIIEKIDLNAGVIFFRKNPYWRGPQPELDGFELHLYNNTDVLALALESGEVDTYYKYASSYPYPNIKRLRATERFDFIEKPHLSLRFLGFNLKKQPMSDLRFREAITFCMNFEEMIKLDILGYGEIPNRGFIPRIMPGFKETVKLEYDLEKAKRLLEDAGYIDGDGDGFRESLDGKAMRLSILISQDYVRLAELVKDYLNTAGIQARLKNVDYNTWISLKDRDNYDFVVSRTSPWGMFMHANWATGYFDARRTGEGVLHNVDDPRFAKLCDDILSTKDKNQLKEYASLVQDYYAEFLPAVALYWSRVVIPTQKKFSGWSPNPLYGIYNVQNFLSLKINQR